MLVENQDLNSKIFDENLENPRPSQNRKTPSDWVFSLTANRRVMKFGTCLQVPITNTPIRFQNHSHIITPFTSRMCGFRGH